MRRALVAVRGGRSLPSIVSAEDEAELVRGRTQAFRFEPELAARVRLLKAGTLAAILVDARAELAERHQEHAVARRLCELVATVADNDAAREGLLEALDGTVIDVLEESRLEYERAEWLRAHGGTP